MFHVWDHCIKYFKVAQLVHNFCREKKLIVSTIRRKRNSSGLSKVGPLLDDWAYWMRLPWPMSEWTDFLDWTKICWARSVWACCQRNPLLGSTRWNYQNDPLFFFFSFFLLFFKSIIERQCYKVENQLHFIFIIEFEYETLFNLAVLRATTTFIINLLQTDVAVHVILIISATKQLNF